MTTTIADVNAQYEPHPSEPTHSDHPQEQVSNE